MALLDVYGNPLCNPAAIVALSTLTTFALDLTHETTGDGIATVFVPLANKTISEVYAHVTATTGTGPTYRIKIETMSASRTPSNTPATASAWVDITASGAGAQWLGGALVANHSTGSTPAPLAITVRYQSGTCDGSNFSTFARGYTIQSTMYSPYALTMTAGTWGGAIANVVSTLVVVYSDGTIQPLCAYGTGTTLVTNNSTWNTGGGTPLYRGNAWTPPVACQVCGVWFVARLPDTWDFRVRVYDGSTLIQTSATLDPDQFLAAASAGYQAYVPLEPFTHPANTKYYYVLEPTTANNPTTVAHIVHASRAAIRAIGGDLVGAVGTSGFSWTTYDNGTDGYRLYPIVPVVSKIDNVTSVVNNCCFPQSSEEMIGY